MEDSISYEFIEYKDSLFGNIPYRIRFKFILNMIDFAQEPADIASEFFEAAYIGQHLSLHCDTIRIIEQERKYIVFEATGVKDTFEKELQYIIAAPEDEETNFYERSIEFEEQIYDTPPLFHELVDTGLINLLHSSLPEEDSTRYPEMDHGYILSSGPNLKHLKLYLSTTSWLIAGNMEFDFTPEELIESASYYLKLNSDLPLSPEDFFPAETVKIGILPSLIFSATTVLHHDSEMFDTEPSFLRFLHKSGYGDVSAKHKSVFVSHSGYIAIVISGNTARITFNHNSVDTVSNEYFNALDRISLLASNHNGNPIDISLPWDEIDDQVFENLCYDVIIEQERFDSQSAHRMGLTNSRDGGRDIMVSEYLLPGVPKKKKWIVQCKYTKQKSLTTSRLDSISDVILQFGVDGYCLMTNSIIDSGVHDRIEGIHNSTKVQMDKWDIKRIERFLSQKRYLYIRERYFPNFKKQ